MERVILAGGRLGDGAVVDVHATDGVIDRVVAAGVRLDDDLGPGPAPTVHDLGRRLLVAGLVEPHAHLDKARLADVLVNGRGDLAGAIDSMVAADPAVSTPDAIVARALATVQRLVANGTTLVRSHVNVGDPIGVANVRALLEVRALVADLVELELAALVHSPLTGSEGAVNRRALDEAIELGVDVVGCCPHLDPDGPGAIAHALDVATAAGLDVDLHTDETLDPGVSTLRELARQVSERGFPHRVVASHCVSLGVQPVEEQHAVAAEVAAAGIAVLALPATNLYLQGRDHPVATPRALAPIQVLRDHGVLVAAGGDNVQDPFNPIGRADPLETAALLVLAGHRQPDDALAMVTSSAREALGRPRADLRPGDRLDAVAIGAPSARAAIADAPADRWVFRAGRLVATTSSTTTLHDRQSPTLM